MPDDLKPKEEETPKEEPTPTVPVDTVTELVGEFKDMLKTVASRPAPVTVSPEEDPAEKRARMLEKYNAVREAANEKAATGDVAGAMEDMYGFITQEAAQNQGAPESDPTTKSLLNSAKRVAKAEHKDEFSKWGSEIEQAMADMPLAERLDPDAWDRAVRRVKADHIDEIIAERVKAQTEESEVTPVAPGSRGSTEEEHIELDADALKMAEVFGQDEETYSEVLKKYDAARSRPGSTMGVAILSDEKPKPGAF